MKLLRRSTEPGEEPESNEELDSDDFDCFQPMESMEESNSIEPSDDEHRMLAAEDEPCSSCWNLAQYRTVRNSVFRDVGPSEPQ